MIASRIVLPDLYKTTRRAALAFVIGAAAVSAASPALAQTDEEKAAARALATQGSEELKAGHFAQALDLVNRAQQIVHAPTHLLMIARAQIGLGKLVSAQETLLKLIRWDLAANAPQAFKNAQAAAKEELAAIEPRIGSLRIILEGVGQKKVTVKLDDQPIPPALLGVYVPADPGPHVVMAYPDGQPAVQGTVELHDAEKKELRLAIPSAPAVLPAPDPNALKAPPASGTTGFFTPLRGAGIGVAAAGLAGLVVGGVFMAKSGSTQSQANAEAIKDGCSPSDPSNCAGAKTKAEQADLSTGGVHTLDGTAASQKTIGAVGLSAGGAALAAGVVLIVIGKPKPATTGAAPSISPWFSGTAGGLAGTF